MKNIVIAFLTCLALTACSDTIEFEDYNKAVKTVEIVVDFNDSISMRQLNKIEKDLNIDFKQNSPLFSKTKIAVAKVNINSLDRIESYLESDDHLVEAASINHIYKLSPSERIPNDNRLRYGFGSFPNDPLYSKQWNFDMINVEKAWSMATGKDVIVAVLDTGISDGKGRYGRVPDLAATCMIKGFNFVNNDEDPSDGHGHGTHVAGTIAQSTNNGIGVTGIAYNACIMPIKVLSDEGFGTTASIAEGIRWAADNGANVLNMSLGGGSYSAVMEQAVLYAYDSNVFLTCSAGNGSISEISFPAGYTGCHAISAVNKEGELAWYSSYGESKIGSKLFITAPGGDTTYGGPEGGILQDTIKDGDPTMHGYFPYQGTSMSAPHVAGVAALVVEAVGVDRYTMDDIEDIIGESAEKKDSFLKFGHGLVNAEKAVTLALADDDDEDNEDDESELKYLLMILAEFSILMLTKVTK